MCLGGDSGTGAKLAVGGTIPFYGHEWILSPFPCAFWLRKGRLCTLQCAAPESRRKGRQKGSDQK